MSSSSPELSSEFLLRQADEASLLRDLEATAELESRANAFDSRSFKDVASRVARLANGTLHVCGRDCPFATADPFGLWVCPYTGLAVDIALDHRADCGTSRHPNNAEHDVQRSGFPPATYKRKRDMTKASRTAHAAANQLGDGPPLLPERDDSESSSARLCCREPRHSSPQSSSSMRSRAVDSRRMAESTKDSCLLVAQAMSIFCKVVKLPNEVSKNGASKESKRATPGQTTSMVRPELLEGDVLYQAALRRYLKQMASAGRAPSMDDIHNISIAAANVVREEKAKNAERQQFESAVKVVESREFCLWASHLTVEIWQRIWTTSYFDSARRGADSFRSFVVGILYITKRGLTLQDGTVLIPKIPAVGIVLQSARQLSEHPLLKTLHSSAHKGVCTLQRSVAALPCAQAKKMFKVAIELAANAPAVVRDFET